MTGRTVLLQVYRVIIIRSDALNAVRDRNTIWWRTTVLNCPEAGRPEYLEWLRAMYDWLVSFEDKLWSEPWPEAVVPAPRNRGQE